MTVTQQETTRASRTGLEIAVIGMAGRFPGADNIEAYWENLKNGVESVVFFTDQELTEAGADPDLLKNPGYIKAKGVINREEYFDAVFFEYTPADARIMDPQIRIFHECVWEALENAGYDPYTYKGSIGLFAGASANIYWEVLNLAALSDKNFAAIFDAIQYIDKDFLTTLISYKLNLRGPSVALQTACSTSLVAVHLACRELLTRGCQIALAGGVSVSLPQKSGYQYQEGMILSPDGHCRAFDAEARGTVGGQGAGVVVLKRLEDALQDGDHIYAVIKGSGANNDGSGKVGYTAPGVLGQAQILKKVYYMADVDPGTVGYIETHGTGTVLGDPIEIEALKTAFNTVKQNSCAIGSVKTNIGHLDAAAGVASLIKTILAIHHKQIPASLHFREPNPRIDFADSPFYVNQELREWPAGRPPLRAGVSSFGIGGTNAHVILEEAPPQRKTEAGRPWHLLLLSAKTPEALIKLSINLADYLEKHPQTDMADLAYTLQIGRAHWDNRRMILCSELPEAIGELRKTELPYLADSERKTIVFMFPGQGSQYVNMGRELYQTEAVFREEVDRCFTILKPLLPFDLPAILYPGDGQISEYKITDTLVTQPLLFVFEYALAQTLMKWGIQPDAMIGHSIGEYVAACLSGVFSLEDALATVVYRGQLMQELPEGIMFSIPLSEAELAPFLTEGLAVAAVNSSSLCVVSGNEDAVLALEARLAETGCAGVRLAASRAFHSKQMAPVLESFTNKLKEIELHKPKIPYLSNLTGKWISVQDATNPEYWARHLQETVRFADGLTELLANDHSVFIEAGPGFTLSTFVRQHQDYRQQIVVNLVKHYREEDARAAGPLQQLIGSFIKQAQDDLTDQPFLLKQLGRLWTSGLTINWQQYYQYEKRQRIVLPGYPFERQRYPIEGDPLAMLKGGVEPGGAAIIKKAAMEQWFYLPSWKNKPLLAQPISVNSRHCLLFINDHHLTTGLAGRLRREFKAVTLVKTGPAYARQGEDTYIVNPKDPQSYHLLCAELETRGLMPEITGHLWNITDNTTNCDAAYFKELQELGFYSLLYLTQAMRRRQLAENLELIVIANNLFDVSGNELIDPAKATILGPCKVIPQEYRDTNCRSIDLIPPETGSPDETALLEHLTREFMTGFNESVVAYRYNQRWVQIFEPVAPEFWEQSGNGSNGTFTPLREGGVYLITGGLGRIGLLLTRYLAEKLNAKIALVVRSEFPSRETWENWLVTHAGDEKVSQLIRKLKECEALGGKVLVLKADLSNPDGLAKAVTVVEESFGPINGVIHAAGILDGILIDEIDKEECEKYFQAKVYGLLGLAEAFRNKELDFCLLMSSLSSVLGGLGFVAYAAANIFMDAFTRRLNKIGESRWLSVNWDGWDFTGEGVPLSSDTGQLFGRELTDLAMTRAEGPEALRRALMLSSVSQAVVSTGPLEARIRKWIKFEATDLQNGLRSKTTHYARPNLSTPYVAPRDELEERLALLWQDLLGISQIGVEDNFFELGGHSLKATVLVARIHRELNIEVSLKEIFAYKTVADLATAIKQKYEQLKELEKLLEEAERLPS